jgi:hypothetical protein
VKNTSQISLKLATPILGFQSRDVLTKIKFDGGSMRGGGGQRIKMAVSNANAEINVSDVN